MGISNKAGDCMMSDTFGPVSLSELMFFVNRAAFGAGCSYGVAEDVANIAVWFAKQGIDPFVPLAKSLDNIANGASTTDIEKVTHEGQIRLRSKSDKPISAIYSGIALSDQLAVLNGQVGLAVTGEDIDLPILAGFVVKALGEVGSSIDLTASDPTLNFISADHLTVDRQGDLTATFGQSTQSSEIESHKAISDHHNILVSQTGWEGIMKHFKKSLVEATEESRNSGAGAGLVDTD